MSSVTVSAPPVAPAADKPWVHRALIANLVCQVGIVVTGGLVRLTGSGLGCPTWPQCVPGSYTPVRTQPQGIHKYVEWGNRTLTSVVGLAALLALVAVVLAVRQGRRPRHLAWLASLPLVGVVVQAVLGGITVLTHLHPATVAAHFLVSAVMVAGSTYLLWRMPQQDGPARSTVRAEARVLAWVLAGLTAVVVVLGTLVTGAGPHSGDADQPARIAIDPRTLSWLHSDVVLIWFGVLLALLLTLRLTDAGPAPQRAGLLVLGIGLAQGLLGYLQYFTGLPAPAVMAHMLGACLLVVAVTWCVLSLREHQRH